MSQAKRDDLFPITVLIPETVADPVEMYDQTAALRLAIVERNQVRTLGSEWDAPGAYILLDTPLLDGTFGVYVGKAAPGGVKSRLNSHQTKKDHWQRVLIIRRDTTHGFNSAQVGWLEGRLYDLFKESALARLHNGNRPSDETLPSFERSVLEASIFPIRRVLRLMGFDVTPARVPVTQPTIPPPHTGAHAPIRGAQPPYLTSGTKIQHEEGLRDLIQEGMIAYGAELISTSSKYPAQAVLTESGIVLNGKTFASVSGAAISVTGYKVNGWKFWRTRTNRGLVKLEDLRTEYQERVKNR